MPRTLPPRPHLGHLKNEAKRLLRAFRADDPDTLERFRQLPHAVIERRPQLALADAQLLLAREYGFASWPQLKAHVDALVAEQPPHTGAAQHPSKHQLSRAQHERVREHGERIVAVAQAGDVVAVLTALFMTSREERALRELLVERGQFTLVVTALLAGVEYPAPHVRFLVAQAMDHYADERCAGPLRRLLDDPVPRVRWAALHSLSCDDCKLAPLSKPGDLVERVAWMALRDESIRVRRVAAGTLGLWCHDARAVAALHTLLAQETDHVLLRSARWALAQQGKAES